MPAGRSAPVAAAWMLVGSLLSACAGPAPVSETSSPVPPSPPPGGSTATPTPSATYAGGRLLFRDDLSSPSSGWTTGDVGDVSVAYADGALRLDVRAADRLAHATRPLPSAASRLRVEALASPDASGGPGTYGITCGTSPEDHFALLLSSAGGHLIVHASDGGGTVLSSSRGGGRAPLHLGPTRVVGECGVSEDGGTELVLSAQGSRVAAVVREYRSGPFRVVGVYAEAIAGAGAFSVTFDDIVVGEPFEIAVGPSPSVSAEPFPTELERVLLEHVPPAFARTCRRPAGPPRADTLAELSCRPRDGADLVTYVLYGDVGAMNEAHEEEREALGVERNTGNCAGRRWPAEAAYVVDTREVGRVLCVREEDGSARVAWTDQRLNIAATAVRADGAQVELLEFWVTTAGPIE